MARHGRVDLPRRLVTLALPVALIVGALGGAGLPAAAQTGGWADQPPPSDQQSQQVEALEAEKQSRTPAEQEIDSNLLYEERQQDGEPAAETPTGQPVMVRTDVTTDPNGRALVDITATVTPDLLAGIESQGGTVLVSVPRFDSVRAWLPLPALEALAARSDVRAIEQAAEVQTDEARADQPAFAARAETVRGRLGGAFPSQTTNAGTATSQGDAAHGASGARTTFGADGSGIKIGVLSDGVKSLANSQASGDLPAVTVLPGQAGPASGDEGTAMLEIIHDVAPGAQLLFATAFTSDASFAQNIIALRDAGAQIIVDDVFYFNEPPFQDGIIAQAVNQVTAGGTLYFSSVGNSGNKNDGTASTWEGDFVDGGDAGIGDGGRLHDFDPGLGVGTANALASGTRSVPSTLSWSDPAGGSANDYDLYLLNSTGGVVAASTSTQNGSQDPREQVAVPSGQSGLRLVITKFGGQNRYLRLATNGNRLVSFSTPGEASGHATVVNAFSVAATPAGDGSAFTSADTVETFSSDGPRRVFFNPNGTAITPGVFGSAGGTVRQDPDITAADGVATTVPGFNPFFGTSAAAPHAAAIAAQVLGVNPQLTPAQVRSALTSSAIDIEAAGTDRDSGVGIVRSSPAVDSVDPTGPSFRGVTPARLQETRSGAGLTTVDGQFEGAGALGAGQTRTLTVTGRGNVPANATAVVLNVTATQPTATGYLTAFPTGEARPNASNLNFTANQTIPNSVTVKVGSGGQVSLFNFTGSAHVLVDVLGYFGPSSSFNALTPARVLETRSGPGLTTVDNQFQGGGPIGPGETRNLTVTGRGGVPATGVGAVVLNVTATEPTASGFLSVFPAGETRPNASNVNFTGNQTIPNLVVTSVGDGGQVSIFNNAGSTQVFADVAGWFPTGSAFNGLTPARLLETRSGPGLTTVDGQAQGGGAIGPGETRNLTVTGRGGVPASGVGAVVLNVTATQPSAFGFLQVFPAGAPRPVTSNLNFTANQTIANLVIARVGANGQVSIFNNTGSTHVIADVSGWFPP